jgi:hypothetical protein
VVASMLAMPLAASAQVAGRTITIGHRAGHSSAHDW